jgi:transposase-like protein
VDERTPEQGQDVHELLFGRPPEAEVVASIEDRVASERRCPHCGSDGAVKRGRANGLRRYRCQACGTSFNALTGTPWARRRHKECWLAFAETLSAGATVRGSADRCGVATTTAFRGRHRFLKGVKTGIAPLRGIVEADETDVLDSHKGERHLDRPARKRGGKASQRGLSREQIPVLVAADRSGATVSAVRPEVSATTIQAVLESVVDKDALLFTEGTSDYPPCAVALGIRHEALKQSAGERVRGELHLQTVNNRHQRSKRFLASFRGIATKDLANDLRWFDIVGLAPNPSARTGLNAARGLQPSVRAMAETG